MKSHICTLALLIMNFAWLSFVNADEPKVVLFKIEKINERKINAEYWYACCFESSDMRNGEVYNLVNNGKKVLGGKGKLKVDEDFEEFVIRWEDGDLEIGELLAMQKKAERGKPLNLSYKIVKHSDRSQIGDRYRMQAVACESPLNFLQSAAFAGWMSYPVAKRLFSNKIFPTGTYQTYQKIRRMKIRTDGEILSGYLK